MCNCFITTVPAGEPKRESAPSPPPRTSSTKNKVYYAVHTLPDGTKVRKEISPNDPLLRKVPITKVRKTPATSTSTVRPATSTTKGGHARITAPPSPSPPACKRHDASEADRSRKRSAAMMARTERIPRR